MTELAGKLLHSFTVLASPVSSSLDDAHCNRCPSSSIYRQCKTYGRYVVGFNVTPLEVWETGRTLVGSPTMAETVFNCCAEAG